MPLISIIVIGRNEEALLTRSLAAAQTAAQVIGGAEIVYVDSASTDRSVEIASSLGIRVLGLKPEWKLSAAAGRYIGFHHTEGEYLLFIDGDTIVRPDFLPQALPYLRRENLAGLSGYLEDIDEAGQPLPYFGERLAQEKYALWLRGGCSLYRRDALAQIGSFNPYLITEEEAELAVRLQQQGWLLLEVPVPMACHLRGWAAINVQRVWNLGRFGAIGKTLRYAWRTGNAWELCRMRLKPTMFFVLLWSVLLIGVSLLLRGRIFAGDAALLCFASALLAVAIKKRSVVGPVQYTTTHVLTLLDVIVGAITAHLEDPCGYPLDAIELNTGRPASSFACLPKIEMKQEK